MKTEHEAYIINRAAYLYIIKIDDIYDYTFYMDNYLVMNTGQIEIGSLNFDQAVEKIMKKHYLKPESIMKLEDDGIEELLKRVDDYNHVNIL